MLSIRDKIVNKIFLLVRHSSTMGDSFKNKMVCKYYEWVKMGFFRELALETALRFTSGNDIDGEFRSITGSWAEEELRKRVF